jgi:isopentenyl-diphosphate Delta-isomerase
MTTTMTNPSPPSASTADDVELSTAQGYDDEQIRLMEEVCIVIDENDQPLRPGTKRECPQPVYTSTDL